MAINTTLHPVFSEFSTTITTIYHTGMSSPLTPHSNQIEISSPLATPHSNQIPDPDPNAAFWYTHMNRTSFAIQRVIDPLIAIFGIIGNLISIAVLTRRWMRSSTNYYLTALAVYDTLYLVFAATMTVSDYEAIGLRHWYKNYQWPIGRPLVDTFSNTGVWLTLTFTIERWLCVCHPMRGKDLGR